MSDAKYMREWRAAHPEDCLAYDRKWKAANKEKRREANRAWRLANPGYYAKYSRKRRASDPEYYLKGLVASRIASALSRQGIRKSNKTLKLVGCTTKELRTHLESTFKSGMSWDSRTEWHIDHIRPCASFDLTNPEQQKLCFHYTNLQALWAKDNLSKGASLTWTPKEETVAP